MKTTICGLLCAAMTISLDVVLSAGEVDWTGGGDTAAWSDAGNWGGTLPTSEDVAVIRGVVPAVMADIATMNGFAGLKIDGENSVVDLSGMTSKTTMTVPLSGDGMLRVMNSSNSADLILNNDNSSFSGTFYTDGAGLTLRHANASGNANTKAVIKNGSTQKYLRVAANNDRCKTFAGEAAFDKAEVWMNPGGGFEFSGVVDILANITQFNSDTPTNYMMRFSGIVTNSTSQSAQFRLKGSHRICDGATVALGSTASVNLFSDVKLHLEGFIASASLFTVNNGYVYFHEANRFAPTVALRLGENGQYPRRARMDLRGFDQQCGNLSACNSDMSSNYHCYYDTAQLSISPATYMTESNTNTAGLITSSAPATFTVLGTYSAIPDNSNYTMVQRRRFIYPIMGHASFELNSTNQSTAATMRFSSPRSTTDGSLICRRGTIVLESTCAFSNLTSIVASNVGAVEVEAGAYVNPEVSLLLSDSSVFTVGEGCVVTAKTACVGSVWLEPDEYVCSEAGLPNLAGSGKLVVTTYGGPKGWLLMFK